MGLLLAEFWPYILGGAAGIIAGMFTAYAKGKSKERDKHADDLRKQQLEALKRKEKIRNEVEAATDDNIIAEFDRLYDNNRR